MKAKILTTLSDKAQGVIGRDKLDDDEIYIFVNIYPYTEFHMQGVPFPLDIAFLDQQFGILDINNMTPNDGRAKAPDKTAYAVEANTGYFNKMGLKQGDFWKEVANKLQIKEN